MEAGRATHFSQGRLLLFKFLNIILTKFAKSEFECLPHDWRWKLLGDSQKCDIAGTPSCPRGRVFDPASNLL
jgi:hypothetical protein